MRYLLHKADALAGVVLGVLLGAVSLPGMSVCHASVVADPVGFPVFWRNQSDAAIRLRLQSTVEEEAVLSGEIAGEPIESRTVRLATPSACLAVPFDPSQLKSGSYSWKLRLTASGTNVWNGSGAFEVRPRLDRDAFKLLHWGGWKTVPDDYLRAVGINSTQVDVFKVERVRHQVEAGFFPNLRYENLKRYKLSSADLVPAKIRERTLLDFVPYEGLHVWTTTLVNSEVYGSAYPQRATNQTEFLAWARKELGFEPDFRYRNAPIELDPKTVGAWPKGVVSRGDCPQLDSLCWVMARGMSPYRIGRLTAEAIHELDSRNVVWSEPSFAGVPDNLDMLADWHYQYLTSATVRELRAYAACSRPFGKPYMPTLSAGYFHGTVRPRVAAADGRRKSIAAQSADEVAIKAWLALAAVPAHALSFFALDTWSEGEKSGVAEPGTGARFGQVWRDRIAPAADLLRDLPNERAPIAVVRPSECRFASGLGWGQVHYPNVIEGDLVKAGVPYDVVYDRELESGALAGYRYAILPMAKTIYADHVAKLEEAESAGCRIVTDSYAAKKFAKGVHLDALTYPYDYQKHRHRIDDVVLPWLRTIVPGLREGLTAWSEGEGETAYTFVKDSGGVKYVTVVNDRRRDVPGFLNGCVTNDWYRPYGAPQTIVTHVNVPDGSAVYEFNAAGGSEVSLKNCAVERPYGASEAKVFCIYPRPLAKLAMDVKDGFVRLALLDKTGKPAPGRQVVAVEVRDPDGTVHDETGRYVMDGGRLRIPLRLAKDDPDGTSAKGWRIAAKELTTGFTASATWWRKDI